MGICDHEVDGVAVGMGTWILHGLEVQQGGKKCERPVGRGTAVAGHGSPCAWRLPWSRGLPVGAADFIKFKECAEVSAHAEPDDLHGAEPAAEVYTVAVDGSWCLAAGIIGGRVVKTGG